MSTPQRHLTVPHVEHECLDRCFLINCQEVQVWVGEVRHGVGWNLSFAKDLDWDITAVDLRTNYKSQ